MKKIYEFTINKEMEVDDIQVSVNAEGKEVKTTTKVKKQVPQKYFIKKPGRALIEDSELFSASVVAKCERAGVFRASQIKKRYLNDGGVLSESQKEEYNNLYQQFFTKQAEYQDLLRKENKNEENTKQIDVLLRELTTVLNDIQTIESQAGNILYQHTAENIARDRTILWWTLELSYQELEDGKNKSVFGEGSYEDRLKIYDKIEENEDAFEMLLIQKLVLVTSLWYLGRAETKEDFDMILKISENKDILNLGNIIPAEPPKEAVVPKTIESEKEPVKTS